MRGDFELSANLVVGVIIAILTIFLLYVAFPRSSCDAEAKISAIEIQKAIECAAGSGEKDCSKTATVKLCQEDAWSLAGGGFVQNYFGLMVPEYLIYYQKFPTLPIEEAQWGAWSDSYPFERSTIGQRPWDGWPKRTLTQFKQFYRTKYLQEGCTSDTGLCLNQRGREDVAKINLPAGISDILLKREATLVSAADPKFHLVAPCFARVSFQKDGDKIFASVAKGSTDASNYCFAEASSIKGLLSAYASEHTCRVADWVLTFLTGGSKAVVQETAKQAAKVAGREIQKEVMEQIVKNSLKKAEQLGVKNSGGLSGIALREAEEKMEVKISKEAGDKIIQKTSSSSFLGQVYGKIAAKKAGGYLGLSEKEAIDIFGVPCLDLGDPCRGIFSCVEAMMWPGWPFQELTPEKMKSWKNREVLGEIFGNCCENLVYGYEDDWSKISCNAPAEIVDLVKIDLEVEPGKDLTMKDVAGNLSISESRARQECGSHFTDTFRTCISADEMKMKKTNICSEESRHTYSMKSPLLAKVLEIYARTFEDDCTTKLRVSYYDGSGWKVIDERESASYPAGNSFIIKLDSPITINSLQIEDSESKCKLDYSAVSINPSTETPANAAANLPYSLPAGSFRFFIAPENFRSSASDMCKKISSCNAIEKWLPESSAWIKFIKESGKVDFSILGGDKIGIRADRESSVIFEVK